MTVRLGSILPVWVVVLLASVLVATTASGPGQLKWLTLVLAGATILTFVVQLAVPNKQGIVQRMTLSCAGSVLILGVTTAILTALPA